VIAQQPTRESRANESSAAGDEDVHDFATDGVRPAVMLSRAALNGRAADDHSRALWIPQHFLRGRMGWRVSSALTLCSLFR
jgi:hypothetical protein